MERFTDRPEGSHADPADAVHRTPALAPDITTPRAVRHSPEAVVHTISIDEVHSSLVEELGRLHFDRVVATVARRRSLTDSLQVALDAHWDAVVDHRDEHRALRRIQAARRDTVTARTRTDGSDRSSADLDARPDDTGNGTPWSPTHGIADWLDLIADAHHIRWELPRDQLSLLVTATLEGLTVGYLATGDPEPARAVLRVLAYQVARYGRRPAKNQQH